MFHLAKILNGRIGVPEPERIPLNAAVTVTYGSLAVIKDGTLSPVSATSATLPTHLILADSEGNEVLAAVITPEMIFEAKVTADPSAMKAGAEYLLSTDGTAVTATAVTSGKRGALLVDKTGAIQAGDRILIAFR